MPTHNREWKNKTCEKCVYRVMAFCRKTPKEIRVKDIGYWWETPDIRLSKIFYKAACAEYSNKEGE